MTTEEREEYRYRIEERLGILCGKNDPTDEQMAIAIAESEEWLKIKWWKEKNDPATPISTQPD